MPNEIVKIRKSYMQDGNESDTVDARELHGKLGVQKKFADWIKSQVNRAGLVRGHDFAVFPLKGNNPSGMSGRPTNEYYLTLDAAKHIAMVSGCEKGHEIR
jgi:phage anti-repressor protein